MCYETMLVDGLCVPDARRLVRDLREILAKHVDSDELAIDDLIKLADQP